MTKSQYYFEHDIDAYSDPKLILLRAEYGNAGCMIYWYLLERMFNEEGSSLAYSARTFKAINYATRIEEEIDGTTEELIAYMIEIGLFGLEEVDGERYFYSSRFRAYREAMLSKREALAAAGRYGAKVRQANKEKDQPKSKSKATIKPPLSNPEATLKPPLGNPEATLKLEEKSIEEKSIEEKHTGGAEAPPSNTLDESQTVIELMLNDKSLHPVTEADVEQYRGLYPAVDVMQELRNMVGWLDSNPERRKTKSGIKRFINGWLSKSQNRSKSAPRTNYQNKPSSVGNFNQRNYPEGFFDQFAEEA